MNIDGLLAAAALELAKAGIEEADLDARLLFQHLTAMTRTQLVLHGRQIVDQRTAEQYRDLVIERSRRIPLQYLTGSREFWSLDFFVSPAVLIPRPETEFLLDQVLKVSSPESSVGRILDLCTGSGVIAVVLAKELGCPVTAVDVSAAALAIAGKNVRRHQVADRVDLICSDLFSALNSNNKFELIVSNPPYIAEEQIGQLEPEVRTAEPLLALSGGPGGLQIIEQIAIEAEKFLQPGGWIFLEIGADQKSAVMRLFQAPERSYDEIRVIKDWAGHPRVLQARYMPPAQIDVP
jgi:release factor glutamine methyltransferase